MAGSTSGSRIQQSGYFVSSSSSFASFSSVSDSTFITMSAPSVLAVHCSGTSSPPTSDTFRFFVALREGESIPKWWIWSRKYIECWLRRAQGRTNLRKCSLIPTKTSTVAPWILELLVSYLQVRNKKNDLHVDEHITFSYSLDLWMGRSHVRQLLTRRRLLLRGAHCCLYD